jgi:hypothetical protein
VGFSIKRIAAHGIALHGNAERRTARKSKAVSQQWFTGGFFSSKALKRNAEHRKERQCTASQCKEAHRMAPN